jgi:DNA replication protein DnaC
MPTETAQKYLDQAAERLRSRISARGKPMTDQEKAAWITGQPERDAKALIALRASQPPFDPASIGLHPGDLGLDWSDIKPGISDAAKAVEAVRPAFERGHGLIFLWGSYGQAKTVIGKILVAQAHAAGKRAAYANFMDALENIRLAFDEQEHKTTELIRRIDWWTSRDVLFLDEFDKCKDTPWAMDRKYQIINRCYQRAIREESLTVIASNRGDDEVDGYIRSRLKDGRLGPIVHLEGADGREVMPHGWKH